jgi:VIT1/CCC1 family predicted Fe2+/Mn2+ transporter
MEIPPQHRRLVQVLGFLTIIAGALVTLLTLGVLLFIPLHQNVAMVVVALAVAVLGLVIMIGGRKLQRSGRGD